MSFVSRIIEGLGRPSSSANLQKIKDEAEKRKSAKTSAQLPMVSGNVESTMASMLEKRIASLSSEQKKKS
jgi:hypothetical protein